MSDFNSIQERLDYGLVQQDTTQNTKPLSWSGVRDIKKLRQQIVIPAYTFNPYNLLGVSFTFGLIFYQYNYTVSVPFRLSNYSQLRTQIQEALVHPFISYQTFLCLRYRTGTIVTRIFLGGGINALIEAQLKMSDFQFYRNCAQFQAFSNQKIPSQFTIEVWYGTPLIGGVPYSNSAGLSNAITIQTSLTRNPFSADDNSPDMIYPTSTIDFAGLSSALPETLPITPDPRGPWNSNY